MTAKPVLLRHKAIGDIEEAVSYCHDEFGEMAALRFIDALEEAYERIGRMPLAGSPRYAHELGLPDLRSWPLQSHPAVIFYVELSSHIDVWRVRMPSATSPRPCNRRTEPSDPRP